ncbi:MAG: 16S rRNA (cytosine(1402)-N(4))-methyltransferase RsmH [Cohaesibacteraceae bacterium]
MADRSAGEGEAPHIPVLLPEVLQALGPLEGKLVVDGTFGAGGYSRALLDAGARVIGFDRDPNAIAAAADLIEASGGRLQLVQAPFSDMENGLAELGVKSVDGIVLDIGVSSMQLDRAERGFAFRFDGPLDMRMDQDGETAADIVNNWSEAELAELFFAYGEERRSRAIARLIVEVREEWPITTTRGLATLIEKLMPVRKRGPGPVIHPATRVFQALRIAVNDELGELASALFAAERLLHPGGRLAVVTFHSLEDRIVKRFFAHAAQTSRGSRHQPDMPVAPARFDVLTHRPVVPGDEEMAANPRARSAKLRAAQRTEANPSLDSEAGPDGRARLGVPLLKLRGQQSSKTRRARRARH